MAVLVEEKSDTLPHEGISTYYSISKSKHKVYSKTIQVPYIWDKTYNFYVQKMILTNTKIIGVDFRKLLSNVVQRALALLLTDATNSCQDLLDWQNCESR